MDQYEQTFSGWKQNISDFLSLNYESKGFSPLVGKIFAQLMFATEPLSLQAIVEQLGVTKAAVSVQIRHMERMGMCRKMPSNNDRKDYYYMSENYSLNHARRIINDLESFYQWADKTLKEISIVETSDSAEQEALEHFKHRFSAIAEMYNMMLPMIKEVEMEWEKCIADRRKKSDKNNQSLS
ncbi:MarR family transcriptional regulator [Paenibacillus sp. SYP-B3998]|uniref:MarR family transcriptional regulator n=1 Tax=Paenibacillus sp. SYP-B3998 TaxID=2678564 RepID=A0A6G3ZZD8_9BACL|nr:MarR family transcriptional regulator [Paenibacillus sp. SYP-B3998]NEW07475.1 MarR family transcriptional regulator [Paenibacillus sp. SYP-B3998]